MSKISPDWLLEIAPHYYGRTETEAKKKQASNMARHAKHAAKLAGNKH